MFYQDNGMDQGGGMGAAGSPIQQQGGANPWMQRLFQMLMARRGQFPNPFQGGRGFGNPIMDHANPYGFQEQPQSGNPEFQGMPRPMPQAPSTMKDPQMFMPYGKGPGGPTTFMDRPPSPLDGGNNSFRILGGPGGNLPGPGGPGPQPGGGMVDSGGKGFGGYQPTGKGPMGPGPIMDHANPYGSLGPTDSGPGENNAMPRPMPTAPARPSNFRRFNPFLY